MNTRNQDRVDWPGVVIVGAGVTGLLIAEQLRERGIPVLLVEKRGLAAGQTGHCHGYLHRGYIYRRLEAAQHKELKGAADWWQERLESAGLQPVARTSVVAFHHPDQREESLRTWDALGMAAERIDTGGILPGALPGYAVPEATVTPREALAAAAPASRDHPVLPGRLVELRSSHDRVESAEILGAHGPLTVTAPAFVLATGLGTASVLGRMGRAGDGASIRTRLSFMLVCHSTQPLPAAFCLPSDEAQGLFVASRRSAAGTVHLFSTFVNFWPGRAPDIAREIWLQGVGRVLAEQLPALWHDPDARWGVYPAGKAELDTRPGSGLPEGGVIPFGRSNALAVLPGKFVLAPALARRAVRRLLEMGVGRTAGASPAALPSWAGTGADWAAEDWEVTPRLTRRQLFEHPLVTGNTGISHDRP
ncbi:NAD(P)/FAD-dependent oxidoreductase [Streptomyces sp. NPDC001985]|uniref:NAD(P)/FAD-dependent oxidoreductase n=1 Tax=Streptomyces sp. NPDC001985 TaxID=3154406 RepID=UPI003332A04D